MKYQLKTNRMSSEIREKDHEWVCKFHSNFDRLLASFEKLFSQRRPPVYGDELLTDKEVSHLLKVSRRTLQDYRSNGILPYIQVGGKILYRASDIERTLMDGYREAYRSRKKGHPEVGSSSSFLRMPLAFSFRCRAYFVPVVLTLTPFGIGLSSIIR